MTYPTDYFTDRYLGENIENKWRWVVWWILSLSKIIEGTSPIQILHKHLSTSVLSSAYDTVVVSVAINGK